MKINTGLFFLGAVLLSAAGCKTTEAEKPQPVSWKEQTAYMSKVRDPRIYGFSIYQTPGGIEYRGGTRLHPNQAESLPMKADDPLRPVVMLNGKFGMQSPVLFDFTAVASWMEFDLAQSLGAVPVNERGAQLVKVFGEDIPGCLSMIPSMRFKQFTVDRPLVYVRMANGPLGTLARGIQKPEVKGVLGWDVLRKFKQIHLDYDGSRVAVLTADQDYVPDPSQLISRIPLAKHTGVCAVRGAVDGRQELILIDPAGDFEVAVEDGRSAASVQLDTGLVFAAPAVAKSTGGTRIGAKLLSRYRITVCPQEGAVYFEKQESGEGQ